MQLLVSTVSVQKFLTANGRREYSYTDSRMALSSSSSSYIAVLRCAPSFALPPVNTVQSQSFPKTTLTSSSSSEHVNARETVKRTREEIEQIALHQVKTHNLFEYILY
jgi:hypothetical protein